MANGERDRGRADRAVTAASAVLAAEAVVWLCFSYRFVDTKRYYSCCGAGQTFGYGPMYLVAAVIIAGSVLTLAGAVNLARGRGDWGWICWSASVLGILDGAQRVITPRPGWQSMWVSRPPWWYTVEARGWPTLLGCTAALALLVYARILTGRRQRRLVQNPV